MVSLIWAMDRQGLIGYRKGLPWPKLPADMRWFRRHTLGKAVVMGRATFESLGGGQPLPQRLNIVLSRQPNYCAEGVVVVATLEQALVRGQEVAEEVMVIGGASIYQQTLPDADRLYLTRVDGVFEGDAWSPAVDGSLWQMVAIESHPVDERNGYRCDFSIWQRRDRGVAGLEGAENSPTLELSQWLR